VVDFALIQSKIDFGYAKAGSVLGPPYQQYRPSGADNPTGGTPIGALNAWLTTDAALQGLKPVAYAKPFWFAAVERSGLQLGDYLAGDLGTFYVNSVIYPAPVGLIQCNRIISVDRMQQGVAPGLSPTYGGDVTADATTLITGWPCAMFAQGYRGAPNVMQFPNDAKLGTMMTLVPGSAPINFQANDYITDDLGNRYSVSNAELTTLGWRLTADLWKQGS